MTAGQNKKYLEINLKPYQPYGIGVPILLFLAGIGVTALITVGIYEWFF